ncbi:MAG: Kelch repeat-containing protein [Planctomycetota bacterium]
MRTVFVVAAFVGVFWLGAVPAMSGEEPAPPKEIPANRFVQVAADHGGHYFSQLVYAPAAKCMVSWGTRVHGKPMRAYETLHYVVEKGEWVDAWPYAPGTDAADGKRVSWAGKYKRWPGWGICAPTGRFYTRGKTELPRPNSSFYQVCWDEHNKRLIFYVGSMTFSYDPVAREWKKIHGVSEKQQPPALLLWGSLCYDPLNKLVLLFGGGGVDAIDGRPHTWALDVTTDRWRRLELEVEPPARCNSRMVYDKKNKQIVLFGGDSQQAGLSDTWVFDVTKQTWEERTPNRAPYPRHTHAMAYLEKSGVVLLAGGTAVAEWRKREGLGRQAWIYDAGANTWTPLDVEVPDARWLTMDNIDGTDEVVAVTAARGRHDRTTYRFRYDPETAAPSKKIQGVKPGTVAYKSGRTPEGMKQGAEPHPEQHKKVLANLPVNTWVKMDVPKTVNGRTWGTSILDTDRHVVLKWGGGHSGYQGTDMAFYDIAANRFEVDMRPAFTPDPFGKWAKRPAGRTFFNTPWTRHMRHTCAYDAVRHVGAFTDAGGSQWYDREAGKSVKWTWLYDPVERAWHERLVPQPFPGGGSVSPIAVPTPKGVIVYQHAPGRTWENSGRMYRLTGKAGEPETFAWERVRIKNEERPYQREHMTIVYDSRRDRLIFLSADRKSGTPELWFFSMQERTWEKNRAPAEGGVSTREAVYIPGQDAVLAYGPAAKNDPVKTRVYLCAENRWVALRTKTPYGVKVHETALEYDAEYDVAVLLWPQRFEGPIVPHLFRLDVDRLGE